MSGYGPSWAARYLVDGDAIRYKLDEFQADAEAYFSDGVEVVCTKWEEISRKGADKQRRYLPMFIDRNAAGSLLPLDGKLITQGMVLPLSVSGLAPFIQEVEAMFHGPAKVVGTGVIFARKKFSDRVIYKKAAKRRSQNADGQTGRSGA